MHWAVKRVGSAVVTILVVVTLSFVLIRLMPGGPADFLRAQFLKQQGQMSQEALDTMVKTYININPSKPLWKQYLAYLMALAQGDLGRSVWYNQSVSSVLASALPWTVLVMGVSVLLSFAISIVLGAMMAYHESSPLDVGSTLVSIVSASVPYYIAGVLLTMYLGYRTGLFPSGGRIGTDVDGVGVEFLISALYHATLPILSIVVTTVGNTALSMRGNSISVLGEGYLRVARLRGLSSSRIATRYVARNAILPLYTGLLISIGNIFGGSIILEVVFNYRGIGYFIYQAVSTRDYPLLMGGFLLITVAVVLSLLIADLTYIRIDPRAGGGSRESY